MTLSSSPLGSVGSADATKSGLPRYSNLNETRDWLQHLLRLNGPFFDADGVLLSAINVRTLQPFDDAWGATQTQMKPPEPFSVNYAKGMAYEDTWNAIGEYLEYLRARYDVTGEKHILDEIRRNVQLAIDVYREDNAGVAWEWESRNGFFRRLYGGRHGTFPYPEGLGTDQHAPLFAGLNGVRDLLDDAMRKNLDDVAVGAIGWYMRRNFAYVYRTTLVHSPEWGEHALAAFVPSLVWAHQATGETKYLKAYHRLHEDYLYNPDHYLRHGQPIVYYQYALKWSTWVPWLCEHAPNANFYRSLFPQFVDWYTTLLTNCLPSGMGYDYDNWPFTNDRYPDELIDQPLELDPTKKSFDFDSSSYIEQSRHPPLRQLRYLSAFAVAKPAEVDVTPIMRILPLCNTPDHFTYWYDPQDKIVPRHMTHRSWALQSQFLSSWLAAYWRLRKLGHYS